MSVSYHLRIDRPFTVADLVAGAGTAIAELCPADAASGLTVVPELRDYLKRHVQTVETGTSTFAGVYGGATGTGPDRVLMTRDGAQVVQLSELDHGFPEQPELGRRFVVEASLDRTRASHMLAAATAVAAARLTGTPVLDEQERLTGSRIADPEEIVAAARRAAVEVRPARPAPPGPEAAALDGV